MMYGVRQFWASTVRPYVPVRNCSENTNVYGVRPFTNPGRLGTMYPNPPPLPMEVRIPQLPWRWGIMYPQLPQGSCGYIAQWACKWKLKL